MRPQLVLPNINNYGQWRYLKGCYIGKYIRILEDVLCFTKQNKPVILVSIDFKKAFDSLNWNFQLFIPIT